MGWTGDSQLKMHNGQHHLVAMVSYAGLFVWSFSFLLLLIMLVKRQSQQLQNHGVLLLVAAPFPAPSASPATVECLASLMSHAAARVGGAMLAVARLLQSLGVGAGELL